MKDGSSRIRTLELFLFELQSILPVLRDFLHGNQVLEKLDLGMIGLEMEACVRILVDGMRACPNLRDLDVENCGLTDAGFQLLIAHLFDSGNGLVSLSAAYNPLSPASLVSLSRFMTGSNQTQKLCLDLCFNAAMFSDPTVAQEFTRSLRHCAYLKDLKISQCDVAPPMQVDIIRAVEENAVLRNLGMRGNPVSRELRDQFLRSLPVMTGLETLPFDSDLFSPSAQDQQQDEKNSFLEALGQNTSLQRASATNRDHNFDATLGTGTFDKMNFFFARNRNLSKIQSFFDPDQHRTMADRHARVLPKAIHRLAASQNGTGVAAVYTLVRGAGQLLCP